MKRFFSLSLILLLPVYAESFDSIQQGDIVPFDSVDFDNVTVQAPNISVRNTDNDVALLRDNEGFMVFEGGELTRVNSYDVDTNLLELDVKDFAKFAALNNIRLSRLSNGEYKVSESGHLLGGGVGGAAAGYWIGTGLTYFVCYGGITIAAACTGPAAPATFQALSLTLAVPIAAAAKAGGIAGGMTGAVATGPV